LGAGHKRAADEDRDFRSPDRDRHCQGQRAHRYDVGANGDRVGEGQGIQRAGQRAEGIWIAVGLQEGGRIEDATMVDYDELDSFLSGIDYISKANPSMTPLPEYDMGYTTAGWLRLVVYTSIKRPGTTQTALQSGHANRTRIVLSLDQLAEFQNLIQQAKTKLDSLRSGK
jgi:hypothetical protein